MARHSLKKLQSLKQSKERFATVTCYDATFAKLIAQAEIEAVLVGDSLGNVIQGNDTTVPVTMEDMAYHMQCVSEGLRGESNQPLKIVDMPYMSYATTEQTLANAAHLMQSGAEMVKVEGGEWLADTIDALTTRGINVCGHLGLTPQSVHALGGFIVQGRDQSAAAKLLADAKTLQDAGAGLLVLECIPTDLARQVTEALSIPVIGIGAGPYTDSQVLVLHDILGLNTGRVPRFVKNYMENQTGGVLAALEQYHTDVVQGYFPAPEHCYDD